MKITNLSNIENNPIANASTNDVNVSKSDIVFVDKNKENLLKKLGISLDDYNVIIAQNPDFLSVDIEKQLEIVSNYKESLKIVTTKEDVEETSSVNSKISDVEFDKAEYNKKTKIEDKVDDCYKLLAKNLYNNGIKSKDGKEILKANGEKAWDVLTVEQKQAEIDKLRNLISQDENFLEIKKKFNEFAEKNDDVDLKGLTIDMLVMNISASTFKGVSFVDFLKKGEFDQAAIREEYLMQDAVPLNETEQATLEVNELLKNQVAKVASKKLGKDIPVNNLVIKDVKLYIKYLNLDSDELIYNELKTKQANNESLSPLEKEILKINEYVYTTSAGAELVKREKLHNFSELETEYNELLAKEKRGQLTSEDSGSLSLLKTYMSSDEAKDLKKSIQDKPQPSTVYEKAILNDAQEINESIAKVGTENIKHKNMIYVGKLNEKIKGMSRDEAVTYISNFLKFNPDASSNKAIYNAFMHDYPELNSKSDNVLEAALNYTEMTPAESELLLKTLVKTSQDSKYHKYALIAAETDQEILKSEDCKGAEFDNKKTMLSATLSNKFHYENEEEATKFLNNQTEVNITITDSKKQLEAQRNVDNSSYSNEKVLLNTANNIHRFNKENQLDLHNDMMASNYESVQEAAASNIKNYDPSVQARAFDSVVASGNQKAIENAVTSLASAPARSGQDGLNDPAGIKPVLTLAYSEDNAVNSLQEKIANGETLTPQEYNSLSLKEQKAYKAAYFKTLSPAKQIKILSSLSDISLKLSIYRQIASSNKEFLKDLIKNDASTAKFIYEMIPETKDLVLNIAQNKVASNVEYADLIEDLLQEKSKKDMSSINSQENPKTASTINSYNSYTTNPQKYPSELTFFLNNDKISGNHYYKV